VKHLQHVCFHGPTALARGQEVLYVTERAVFEVGENGVRVLDRFDVTIDELRDLTGLDLT
jgi:propionate CoA-transferase